MEVLSDIDVLGPNLVDDSARERSVKYPEVNTLDTIRDIEKGLEANLQEYMDFLQVLTKDNSRRGATPEWVSKDAYGSQELEVIHATRPKIAPLESTSHIHEHLELAERVSHNFDASTVASDSSCEIGQAESSKLSFQTVISDVISEVDLEWETVPRGRSKTWNSVSNVPAPKLGHVHHDCSVTKTESRNILQGLNGRIRTWSTEPISESHTPKSILSSTGSQKDKVSVCVRMRPFNEHEKVCPLKQVLCSQKDKVIVKDYNYLRHGNTKTKAEMLQFDVDHVLDDSFLPPGNRQRKEESQRRMFDVLGKPCVENALEGCNTTVEHPGKCMSSLNLSPVANDCEFLQIMAYGQMGSGKTYTMMGDGTLSGTGLVPRIVHELMHRVHEDQKSGVRFTIQVSYLEIYQEKVRDLLVEKKMEHNNEESGMNCSFRQAESSSADGRGSSFSFHGPVKKDYLRVREHPVTGPYVEGLIWKDVMTCGEMDKLVKQGAANRTLGSTNTHRLSSRGHTLFTIKLIRMYMNDNAKNTSVSHINLVDLAGSEKMVMGQKPSAERTYESKYINRSLAQLNDVFTNLSSGRSNGKFVSYRSSSLTWLLRESLCGSSKTFMVANISPAEQDFQESVHTLRCAAKAKRIHGPPNQDPDTKKQILMKMNEEIRTLQYLIADLTKNTSTEIIPLVKRPPDSEAEVLPPSRDHVDAMLSSPENVRPASRHQRKKSGVRTPNVKEKLYANKRILVISKDNSL